VAAQLTLIREIQTDEYWQDVTSPILEDLRKKLRGLIGLIEKGTRRRIYSDFEDEIGQHSELELHGVPTGPDMSRFRDNSLHCLKTHLTHIAVQKARRNEPLTPQDIDELGRLFRAAGLDSLEPIEGDGGFGPFIRAMVGLERDAAKALFADFQRNRNLTAAQIEFLSSTT
jgi:type I restriction enzyme R subunit